MDEIEKTEEKKDEVNSDEEQDDGIDFDEEFGKLFAFLQTDSGKQLSHRILDMIESVRKNVLEERIAINREKATVTKKSISLNWWGKMIGLLLITGSIATLSILEKLTPEAATILGAMAGYLFGQNKS